MKKLFTAFALSMALFTNASAQKHEVYVDYSLPTLKLSEWEKGVKEVEEVDFKSVELGYNYYMPMKQENLYVTFGGKFSYRWRTFEDYYPDAEESLYRFQLPVNLKCKFNVADNFTVEPYAGVNLGYFFTYRYTNRFDGSFAGGSKLTRDMFEYDDEYNRFSTGWQVGLDLCLNKKFVLGIGYEKDLSYFLAWDTSMDFGSKVEDEKERMRWSSLNIKFGYRF